MITTDKSHMSGFINVRDLTMTFINQGHELKTNG